MGSRLGINRREVDILLGADMIHFFPKLDHTVEKLSLLMTCKNTAGQFSSPHILPELRIRAYKCFLQQVMLMSKYRVKE